MRLLYSLWKRYRLSEIFFRYQRHYRRRIFTRKYCWLCWICVNHENFWVSSSRDIKRTINIYRSDISVHERWMERQSNYEPRPGALRLFNSSGFAALGRDHTCVTLHAAQCFKREFHSDVFTCKLVTFLTIKGLERQKWHHEISAAVFVMCV